MERNQLSEWAIRLQALAQAGLHYTKDVYDQERFEEIRQIASLMLASQSDYPSDQLVAVFANETGYQTPKLDCRAAIFNDQDQILLVQEKDERWSLSGGWVDVDQTLVSNMIKEAHEEAGLEIEVLRLIAIQDHAKNNPVKTMHNIEKVFFECRSLGGQFQANSETIDAQYFALDKLPNLSVGKTTAAQIQLCFQAHHDPHWQVPVD